jgi:hypothetical protein
MNSGMIVDFKSRLSCKAPFSASNAVELMHSRATFFYPDDVRLDEVSQNVQG